MNTNTLDPQTNIRTDLWPKMTITELANQQDMLLSRLSLLASMPGGPQSTETIRTIYKALHTALDDINYLIEQAATTNKKKV